MAKKPDENKPRYELRRRSENYVGLFDRKRCLCAICIKTNRGVLDAKFLLQLCNDHDKLSKAKKTGGR